MVIKELFRRLIKGQKNGGSFIFNMSAAVVSLILCAAVMPSGLAVSHCFAQDAESAEVRVLTLENCVEMALKNNPDISGSAYDELSRKSAVREAEGLKSPLVNFDGGYQHHIDPQRIMPATANNQAGIFSNDLWRADAVLKVPLYTGGKIENEIALARKNFESASLKSEWTRQDIIFKVSTVFYGIIVQKKVIDAFRFSLSTMKDHYARVKELIDAGKASALDLMKMDVRIADIEQNLENSSNFFRLQKVNLLNFMGVDTDESGFDFSKELIFADTGQTELKYDTDSLVKEALGARRDYAAMMASIEAQRRKISVIGAAKKPVVSLVGLYGARGGTSGETGKLGYAGVAVTAPIQEGGVIRARTETEKMALKSMEEKLRKFELQIKQEVKSAVLDILSSTKRVRATQKSIDQAKEALRIETEKYNFGKSSITDVLDAQAALLNAETNYYKSLAEFLTATERLKYAKGGIQ